MPTLTRAHVQPDGVTDLADGFLTREIGSGVYLLTNGNYQSVFVVTDDGVVLLDAPEPLIRFLPTAIAEVTAQPVTTLIYSHGHSDHIGGAHLIAADGVEIIAEERVAAFLRSKADPRRPAPTRTFAGSYTLERGGRTIELTRENFHSSDGDLLVHLPAEKVLVAIDVLAPGWVPLLDFDFSENMFEYLNVFDRILGLEFDALVSGHTADVATRADVELTKTYVLDVYETVRRVHDGLNLAELLDEDRDDEQAGIKAIIDTVTRTAAQEVSARWLDGPMKGVDLWTESHCRAMLIYVRWSD